MFYTFCLPTHRLLINAHASLRCLTLSLVRGSSTVLGYGVYTRSVVSRRPCTVTAMQYGGLSMTGVIDTSPVLLDTMFTRLMRSSFGCKSFLTMVGIQFVLPCMTGRWGYVLRIYARHIILLPFGSLGIIQGGCFVPD